jgi:anti-sigma factor RsiW
MMHHSMTCDVFTDRLMAYLEDETDAPTRAAIERHAVTCVECGAILADLRKLRIDAANLPELAPSRDLWSGVAARIEAPVLPIGRPAARRAAVSARVWRAGAVAASLVGTTALGYLAGTRPLRVADGRVDTVVVVADAPVSELRAPGTAAPSAPSSLVATTTTPASPRVASPAPTVTPATYSAARVVAALTADYDKEIRQLSGLLESRRNQLDPVTVAVIERNLQVIEAAITESKLAIARDPASRFLIESLNQSLQMKVELMRTAAMLPSRT